jgi:hypothetical protein
MRSSYDSHSSLTSTTSSSLRNSNYTSPLDISLIPFSGSDRAEFRDRYQNKVKEFFF